MPKAKLPTLNPFFIFKAWWQGFLRFWHCAILQMVKGTKNSILWETICNNGGLLWSNIKHSVTHNFFNEGNCITWLQMILRHFPNCSKRNSPCKIGYYLQSIQCIFIYGEEECFLLFPKCKEGNLFRYWLSLSLMYW